MDKPTSAQEVFNQVVTHLRAQGVRSVHNDGGCAYRSPGGNKCAVGCLIPDEVYHPSMEGTNVNYMLRHRPELVHLSEYVRLLGHLQHLHDNIPSDHWEYHFPVIAKDFNLEMP